MILIVRELVDLSVNQRYRNEFKIYDYINWMLIKSPVRCKYR